MPWASVVVGRRRLTLDGPETAQVSASRDQRTRSTAPLSSLERHWSDRELLFCGARWRCGPVRGGLSPVDDVDAVLCVGGEEHAHEVWLGSAVSRTRASGRRPKPMTGIRLAKLNDQRDAERA